MSVYGDQLQAGLIHACMPKYLRLLQRTRDQVAAMARRCARPYVSVSWGKQSIVLAHLARELAPEAPLVHWGGEQERHIANFAAVRADFLGRFGGRYIEVDGDALMADKLRHAGHAWTVSQGFQGVYMGLAKEESRARRMTLSRDVDGIYTYSDGILRCCPLADWRVPDLAAYIATHRLKMLDLYERYGLDIRTSSRIKASGHTRAGLEYLSSTRQHEVVKSWPTT